MDIILKTIENIINIVIMLLSLILLFLIYLAVLTGPFIVVFYAFKTIFN